MKKNRLAIMDTRLYSQECVNHPSFEYNHYYNIK